MILEGLCTTTDVDGRANLAPMGAEVDEPQEKPLDRLVLRPFQTTKTFANLKRTGGAVFHVTDDVELLARAAVGRFASPPKLLPARAVDGWILSDACRWYAVRARRIDEAGPRARVEADVVDRGRIRDFFGLNRAKHAVVEAAVLATRTHLLETEQIRADLERLAVLVEKTGGARERSAFQLLVEHIHQAVEEVP